MSKAQNQHLTYQSTPATNYLKPKAMPFETVTLDFITKLPILQGYDSILTIMDHDCSKAAIFIPCKEAMTAEETAELIVQHVFP